MEIVGRKSWLLDASAAARAAGHIFPGHAACEAALESAYGSSKLARDGKNLFGMKQHSHPLYETLALPTQEWSPQHNGYVPAVAEWVKYPDLAACFSDRMHTLRRLAAFANAQGEPEYPHYANALIAQDGQAFVTEVSQHWSTDPRRAQKVLQIYNAYFR